VLAYEDGVGDPDIGAVGFVRRILPSNHRGWRYLE